MNKPKIALTDQEATCFDLLKKAAEAHGIICRVAGGWVRDKLLGRDSHDIDIAIDKMTGAQFARDVLHIPVSVIPANPDQSKHLEKAAPSISSICATKVAAAHTRTVAC
jgi:tRNA nucleotidyltransferase/poly(A) polymerase